MFKDFFQEFKDARLRPLKINVLLNIVFILVIVVYLFKAILFGESLIRGLTLMMWIVYAAYMIDDSYLKLLAKRMEPALEEAKEPQQNKFGLMLVLGVLPLLIALGIGVDIWYQNELDTKYVLIEPGYTTSSEFSLLGLPLMFMLSALEGSIRFQFGSKAKRIIRNLIYLSPVLYLAIISIQGFFIEELPIH